MAGTPELARQVDANWVRSVMADETDWKVCQRCHKELTRFSQGTPFHEFVNPKSYTGHPLYRLKYLFIYTTGKGVWNTLVDEFKQTISDAAGASVKDVFGTAKVTFITDSQVGDEVLASKALPNTEMEQLSRVYPELGDQRRFAFHLVVFKCEPNRHGLMVFAYDLS